MKAGIGRENFDEIEHFVICDFCGALVNMRDLKGMAHMHGWEPLDLTNPTLSR